MEARYPNLELIEYKFLAAISNSCDEFKERFKKAKEKNRYVRPDFDVHVFPQVWGSTCTAFDVSKDGSPVMAGQAMTKAYTTVIHEVVTDVYGVFIGNEGVYIVTNPTDVFLEDVKHHSIKSSSQGKEVY